ncbi:MULTISPECIES: PaaI family thioesterase [unclassified Nocardia]|uniref:PaaI family thioesterase n=1 Tax=unclassified Nocardia TaxID=2637762 RepID=UPI0035DEAE88
MTSTTAAPGSGTPATTVRAADPARRATEVSAYPTLPTERRFRIRVVATDAGRVHAQQTLPLETARTGTHLAGSLGPLVDFTIGRATQTVLSPTVAIRTAGLRMDLLSTALTPGEIIEAHSRILDLDNYSVYGEVHITTADGRPVARASARMLIVPGEIGPTDPADAVTPPHPPTSLAALLTPLTHPMSAGGVTLTAPTAPWMTNPWGIAHGGIPAAFAGLALEDAAHITAGPVRFIDLSLTYHRPITLGEDDIHTDARIDRLGARTLAATCSVYQQDSDRPAATATASLIRM